jgi:hypothetical protein
MQHRKEFKSQVQNRLQKIRKEVITLLRAVQGSEAKEQQQMDLLSKKIKETLGTTSNLQSTISKVIQ